MTDIESIADKIGLPNHMKISTIPGDSPETPKLSYSVLLNPNSISVSHGVDHSKLQANGDNKTEIATSGVRTDGLNIDLLFDSTGSLGKIPLVPIESVLEQIQRFMNVAFNDTVKMSEPRNLQIIWGDFQFKGHLESVSITYSHFDATGSPIRAKAACSFVGEDQIKTDASANKSGFEIDLGISIDYSRFKHGINAVQQYGSYISILSNQPLANLPNSLRNNDELSQLIIKE